MSFLNIENGLDVASIVERLEQAKKTLTVAGLGFDEVEIDESILQATLDLMREYSHRSHPTMSRKLCITRCPSNPFLEYLVETAVGMDLFQEIEFQGNLESIETGPGAVDAQLLDPDVPLLPLDAIFFRMKFSSRLTKLELINLPLSRDHVESLMYGIETGANGAGLQILSMEGILFGKDAIEELCEGFPNNQTIQSLEMRRCRLCDEHMALLLVSLSNLPTLVSINLSENHCRHTALEALDRMLTPGPAFRLEYLDLSHQFTSEESIAMGDRIRLEILTGGRETKINRTLRTLVLSGNQILDQDMKHVALLLRRFPSVEELDLRFNDISTLGLEMMAACCKKPPFVENKAFEATHDAYRIRSRIRTIRLTNNPLTTESSVSLLDLLKIHPELQLVQSNLAWEETPEAKDIRHLMDINRAGRILLVGSSSSQSQSSGWGERSIPLSIWPIVLSRLTRNARFPQYIPAEHRANGIYYLIRHGPIFMEKVASKAPWKETTIGVPRPGQKRKRDSALGGHYSLSDFLRFEAGVAT